MEKTLKGIAAMQERELTNVQTQALHNGSRNKEICAHIGEALQQVDSDITQEEATAG